jgi:RNA polymerase primary sigma factor
MRKISKAVAYLEQQFEREPSHKELAEFLNISEKWISENSKIKNRQVSFDKPINFDGEGISCLYDLIPMNNLSSPDNELVTESVRINLSRALKKLTAREAKIIKMSFGLNNNKVLNLNEIAFFFNMSCERVRQIRSESLIKLKLILSDKKMIL